MLTITKNTKLQMSLKAMLVSSAPQQSCLALCSSLAMLFCNLTPTDAKPKTTWEIKGKHNPTYKISCGAGNSRDRHTQKLETIITKNKYLKIYKIEFWCSSKC